MTKDERLNKINSTITMIDEWESELNASYATAPNDEKGVIHANQMACIHSSHSLINLKRWLIKATPRFDFDGIT